MATDDIYPNKQDNGASERPFRERFATSTSDWRCGEDESKPSIKELAQHLRNNIEQVAALLPLGKRTKKSSSELRYRGKGGLLINLSGEHQGRWHDYESDEGGDAMDLLKKYAGLQSYDEVLQWTENNIGLLPGGAKATNGGGEGSSKQATSDDDAKVEDDKISLDDFEAGKWAIANTPGEAYLRSRGITKFPNDDSIVYFANTKFGYGAVAALITNDAGEMEASHFIFVTSDGHKAPLKVQKRTYMFANNWNERAVFRLPGKHPIIISEGVENALTCWQVTGHECWATVSVSNLGKKPIEPGTKVIISRDGNAPESAATSTLRNAVHAMERCGVQVLVTEPPLDYDTNKLLQEKGEEVVRSLIEEAKPFERGKACTLEEVHEAFIEWFGEDYDLDSIDMTCIAGVGERLDGDPIWLLIISGPGNCKTETVQSLTGARATLTSTIASEGALLSATSKKDRSKDATGGLLCKIGERGVLIIKDVTTILSSSRETRGGVLAALREIYDGYWERNVGSDGGRTLRWSGRLVVVGAVTTAWDSAHSVISVMGDRFVLLRTDSNTGNKRRAASTRAIRNTGQETQMRQELAEAVGGLVLNADISLVPATLTEEEIFQISAMADIVTRARTAVEFDYKGNVIRAHDPEMPTRFAKQLTQVIRGAVVLGMPRKRGMELAVRCARDSIPPLRLGIILDLVRNPDSRPVDVRRRLDQPWSTVKREMEALHMLHILRCDEEETIGKDMNEKTVWKYSIAKDFDQNALKAMVKSAASGPTSEGVSSADEGDPAYEKAARALGL